MFKRFFYLLNLLFEFFSHILLDLLLIIFSLFYRKGYIIHYFDQSLLGKFFFFLILFYLNYPLKIYLKEYLKRNFLNKNKEKKYKIYKVVLIYLIIS